MPVSHTSYLIPHTFSAVLITHNAADTIGQCVAALRKVCDEVLVLDTNSTDGTIEICEQLGATVVQQECPALIIGEVVINHPARPVEDIGKLQEKGVKVLCRTLRSGSGWDQQ